MRPVIVGVIAGGLACLASMLLLGVVHRYVYGPALAPYGDPAFFTDMSAWGIVILVVLRVVSAWLGSSVAVRISDEPHATWTGPIVVMVCALTAVILLGMSQPIWSLLLTAVLVFAVGWAVGRAHVGMPIIPGLDRLGGRDPDSEI